MSLLSFSFPSYSSLQPHCDSERGERDWSGLTCVIRTDADVATEYLRNKIVKHTGQPCETVKKALNKSYEAWGRKTVKIIADHLDYSLYGSSIGNSSLKVHFFRSSQSSECVVSNAMNFLRGNTVAQNGGYLMVSLDDMIRPYGHHSLDFAFSRKFDRQGKQELGYVARPGYDDIASQIEKIRLKVNQLSLANEGVRVPIIFLEDNIRRANMINWVIKEFKEADVFKASYVAGISTCFCSADVDERKKVQFEDQCVPILTVADYNSRTSDVITPRDLFFDGYIVDIDGHVGRLPALFMDVVARFKINAETQERFKSAVALANIVFCMDIKRALGVDIPFSWMENGKTITKLIGKSEDSLVVDAMKSFIKPLSAYQQEERPAICANNLALA